MALTDKQQKDYLANGGNNCPKCGGNDMECSGLDTDGTEAWRNISCNDKACGFEWIDIYTLTGVEEKT